MPPPSSAPLRLVCALALAFSAACQAPEPASEPDSEAPGATAVLVHGAWGGGWDWRPVDRMLTARGWDVYRVTLTGQGERVHLVGPDVDLSTHIQDVVNTILFEDLREVVLLGHSYGGMVITGVADSIPERLHTVVYLDAFLPFSGESVAGFRDGSAFDGLEVIEAPWVDPSDPYPTDVPHPAATFREVLELDGDPAQGVNAAYILTVEPGAEPDGFQTFADRAEALGWPVYVMDGDHNVQRSAREELVRLIEEIASGS